MSISYPTCLLPQQSVQNMKVEAQKHAKFTSHQWMSFFPGYFSLRCPRIRGCFGSRRTWSRIWTWQAPPSPSPLQVWLWCPWLIPRHQVWAQREARREAHQWKLSCASSRWPTTDCEVPCWWVQGLHCRCTLLQGTPSPQGTWAQRAQGSWSWIPLKIVQNLVMYPNKLFIVNNKDWKPFLTSIFLIIWLNSLILLDFADYSFPYEEKKYWQGKWH